MASKATQTTKATQIAKATQANQAWTELRSFVLSPPYEKKPLIARVLKTDDGKLCFLDIRIFANDKPSRIGVCLYPSEAKWIYRMINDRTEGWLHHARDVHILRVWDGVRITVYKGTNRKGELSILAPEFQSLLVMMPQLLEDLEAEARKVGAPTDFDGTMNETCANMFSA